MCLFFSCQSVQNFGLAVVSILAGIIVDNGGFFMLEIFFLGWLGGVYLGFSFKSLVSINEIKIFLSTLSIHGN